MSSNSTHESAVEHYGNSAENPPKRSKRGKYVSKACTHCQKRKIKCDGGIPCRPCLARRRSCMAQTSGAGRPRTAGGEGRSRYESETNTHFGEEHHCALSNELFNRLAQLEQQLNSIVALGNSQSESLPSTQNAINQNVEPPRENLQEALEPELETRGSSHHQSVPKPSVEIFSGETSIAHTLSQMKNRLENLGVTYQECSSVPPSQPLTPLPEMPTDNGNERSKHSYVQQLLLSHGISVDRTKWDNLMHSFCDEVYTLYPFLHLPAIWSVYHQMWEDSFLFPADGRSGCGEYRILVAQVFLCLATGMCTGSSRVNTEDGRHSAGWSLYSMATDILGDLFEVLRESARPIQALQTLGLMVVHLFRLDANEQGEKVLALAISHAHHLGIHRQKVLDKMPVFEDEMFRRLWWCLYVLDRRLALETGRPFLIQDVNVDTAMPRSLGPDWLSTHDMSAQTSTELDEDIQMEISQERITPIPFLITMIRYSRVVGKVWEALYGATETEIMSNPLLNEYLETLISKFQRELPPELVYNLNKPFEIEAEGFSWWQMKQKVLTYMRITFLRLLIRKPTLQRPRSAAAGRRDDLENESTCIQLARSLIDQFIRIPDTYPKTMFPLLHYLTRATMISLGLIVKEPLFKQKYGGPTVLAARTLKVYCRKTWVSGKIVRTVSTLNHIASKVLGEDATSIQQKVPLKSKPLGPPLQSSHHKRGPQNPDLNTLEDNTTSSSTANGFGNEPLPISWVAPSMHHVPCTNSITQPTSIPQADSALHISGSPFYAQPPPLTSSTSPSSGLSDLVMTDFDFEDIMHRRTNTASFSGQENGNVQFSPHDRYQILPFAPVGSSKIKGREGNGNGENSFEKGDENAQSKDTLNAEWLEALLGPGLDLDNMNLLLT